uniref:Retinaldehyde binding protein 1a n=2 Tax=Nothobranchius TaxID=28779 RepID=A0A1A8QA64_9TELE
MVKNWKTTSRNLKQIFCLQILMEELQWLTTRPSPPNFLALKTLLSEEN